MIELYKQFFETFVCDENTTVDDVEKYLKAAYFYAENDVLCVRNPNKHDKHIKKAQEYILKNATNPCLRIKYKLLRIKYNLQNERYETDKYVLTDDYLRDLESLFIEDCKCCNKYMTQSFAININLEIKKIKYFMKNKTEKISIEENRRLAGIQVSRMKEYISLLEKYMEEIKNSEKIKDKITYLELQDEILFKKEYIRAYEMRQP